MRQEPQVRLPQQPSCGRQRRGGSSNTGSPGRPDARSRRPRRPVCGCAACCQDSRGSPCRCDGFGSCASVESGVFGWFDARRGPGFAVRSGEGRYVEIQHQRTSGVEEVLPLVPRTHTAQRDAVATLVPKSRWAGLRAGSLAFERRSATVSTGRSTAATRTDRGREVCA